MPTNTHFTTAAGISSIRIGEPNVMGMSALSDDLSSSYFTGDVTKRAIQRLQKQGDPWFVTSSFHSPVSFGKSFVMTEFINVSICKAL
jgi:hypothetical protein